MGILALICIIGTLLVCIEIFLPGFGIFGISGIVLLIGSIIFGVVKLGLGLAFIGTMAIVCVLVGYIIYLLIKKFDLEKYIVLKENLEDELTIPPNIKIGDIGTTLTVLRNFGKAKFENGDFEVFSPDKYIEIGEKIKVVDISENGNKIIVDKF